MKTMISWIEGHPYKLFIKKWRKWRHVFHDYDIEKVKEYENILRQLEREENILKKKIKEIKEDRKGIEEKYHPLTNGLKEAIVNHRKHTLTDKVTET